MRSKASERPSSVLRIVIIGLGLIGGSLALAVRRARPGATVVGVDHPEILEKAREKLSLDDALTDPHLAVADAEVVFLATPISKIMDMLAELATGFRPDAIVTDVGSTKRQILEAASPLPADVNFIGGHPMAGKEVSGLEEADADLFLGASWALVPRAGTSTSSLRHLSDLVRELGARPILTNAEEHDRSVAVVSHLPQILSVLLCEQAATARALELAGPAFRNLARLARSPEDMWREILASNRDKVSAALLELAERLRKAERELNADGLEEHFHAARKAVEGKLSRKD